MSCVNNVTCFAQISHFSPKASIAFFWAHLRVTAELSVNIISLWARNAY